VACDHQLVLMSFCSRPSCLKLLRCLVRDVADMAGLDVESADAVALAVNDVGMNMIRHGYAMNTNCRIELQVRMEPGALAFNCGTTPTALMRERCVHAALTMCRVDLAYTGSAV
jgi:anti-sigma regulatory factor (Ser/Thr protein kinase)